MFKKDFNEDDWHDLVNHTDPNLLYAEHVRADGRFFNPWLEKNFNVAMLRHTFKYFTTKTKYVPDNFPINVLHSKVFSMENLAKNSISFLGHATFVINLDDQVIILDPFFSKFAAFIKRNILVDFNFNSVPKKPVVLISHNHYDHLDKFSVKKLIKRNAIFLVPLKLGNYFRKLGAQEVYEMDWWQDITIGAVKYTFLPSQHWSVRIGQRTNTTLWGSFMIEGSQKIYFSGDSGYFIGYKEFGRRFPNIDYSLLGVGAYYPRWQRYYQHQDVNEFFLALDDLKTRKAIPMHYGAIKLGKESIDYPPYEIAEIVKNNPKYYDRVQILKIGEIAELI